MVLLGEIRLILQIDWRSKEDGQFFWKKPGGWRSCDGVNHLCDHASANAWSTALCSDFRSQSIRRVWPESSARSDCFSRRSCGSSTIRWLHSVGCLWRLKRQHTIHTSWSCHYVVSQYWARAFGQGICLCLTINTAQTAFARNTASVWANDSADTRSSARKFMKQLSIQQLIVKRFDQDLPLPEYKTAGLRVWTWLHESMSKLHHSL